MPGPGNPLLAVDLDPFLAFHIHGQIPQAFDDLLQVLFVDLGEIQANSLFLQSTVHLALNIIGQEGCQFYACSDEFDRDADIHSFVVCASRPWFHDHAEILQFGCLCLFAWNGFETP